MNQDTMIDTRIFVNSRNSRNQYVDDTVSVFAKRRRGQTITYIQSDHAMMSMSRQSAIRLAEALLKAAGPNPELAA